MTTSSYANRVKENRVFFLGAGFSAAAGVPLTQRLLSDAMRMFESECNGIFQRVDNYARQCFQINDQDRVDYSSICFSELCTFLEFIELREYGGGERYSSGGSREKINLRYYLAKTLVQSTPDVGQIPELYIDFANELHENDVVVSFNWDPLLERALLQINKPFSYIREPGKIHLTKPHGSVNWRLGDVPAYAKSSQNYDWSSLDFLGGMMEEEMYCSMPLLFSENWERRSSYDEVNPFLVLPGYGKAFDARANAPFWYRPEFLFAFTHDIYIIGLSLAPDDFFIRSFFLSILPDISGVSGVDGREIRIINPSADIRQNYSFVGSSDCEMLCESFDDSHVSLMRSNRLNLKVENKG